MKTIRIIEAAELELNDASEYYESQAKGLGFLFLHEVEKTLERIAESPSAWTSISEHVRRRIVKRFPFGILFSELEEEIVVIAVMNLKRKPRYWINRLERL